MLSRSSTFFRQLLGVDPCVEQPYYVALIGAGLLKLSSIQPGRLPPPGLSAPPADWAAYPARALRFRIHPGANSAPAGRMATAHQA